jgi:hypothetical protein
VRVRHSASLPVYIQDTSYTEQEDQSDWEERSIGLKASLEKEFECTFHEADIWPGASFPAFVVQLAGEDWPYLAMSLYVFFKGKDIQENLDAWAKLYNRINPFRKYKPYFNREGSAVRALKATTEALGHEPSSIRLVGYRVIQVGEPPLSWDAVTGIDQLSFTSVGSRIFSASRVTAERSTSLLSKMKSS